MKKNLVIILAGGSGVRFKEETPKQFLKLAGKLIIEHTLERFENHPAIEDIFIVTNPEFYDKTFELVHKNNYKKIKKILKGGPTRQESSEIGLQASENNYENVLIHDAVRPFLSKEIIDEILKKLEKYHAVDVAIPTPDTIIEVDENNVIKNIPKRNFLRRGQTPQGFKLETILKAHLLARENKILNSPDDCSLILKFDLGEVYVVNGSDYNIKITYPIDIHIADKIFQIRNESAETVDVELLERMLKDKVIVVFGGSRGIGKSIYYLAKQYGAISYNFSLSKGCDVRNYDDVRKAFLKVFEEQSRIDAVIITAAILNMGFIEAIGREEIENHIKTNLIGNIYAAKESIDYLKQTEGHLLFFASSSYTRGRKGYTLYSSTKAGIVNFAQGLADELSKYGIKVNVINPERTATSMRKNNFGMEDPKSLLNPDFVALNTLSVLTKNATGSVFDIRKQED